MTQIASSRYPAKVDISQYLDFLRTERSCEDMPSLLFDANSTLVTPFFNDPGIGNPVL